jgi:membrane associated rhomboid family serine protease
VAVDPYSLIAIAIMLGSIVAGSFRRFSWTQMLVLGNMLVFVVELLAPNGPQTIINDLGFRPSYLTSGENLYTVFTNLFVHLNALHLLGNMIFLYLIGMPLESRVGKGKFIAIYLLAGVVGSLAQGLVMLGTNDFVVMVGASGAISGAMGAMLLLYPRDKIPMIVFIVFLPAVEVWIAVGSWIGYQLIAVFLYGLGPVAYVAHIGGFLAGGALAQFLPSRAQDRSAGKVVKLEVAPLEELATTDKLKEALDKIREEAQPDIRQAWLEYFASHATCPKCDGPFKLQGYKLVSTCGFEVDLK